MWEPTAEIQAAAAAPSRAIGCGGDRRGKRSTALGREGTDRERQSRSGPGARGCGSWGRRREHGHRAERRAARRGEGAAAGSALIGRAGPGARRHRTAGREAPPKPALPAAAGARVAARGRACAERRWRAGGHRPRPRFRRPGPRRPKWRRRGGPRRAAGPGGRDPPGEAGVPAGCPPRQARLGSFCSS